MNEKKKKQHEPAEVAAPEVVTKIKKLLALATSSDVHEAAAAAAKAQELIDRYRVDEALLDDEDPEAKRSSQPIVRGTLYSYPSSRAATWSLTLASALGKANGVSVWYSSGAGCASIQGAGTQADLETVRYLQGYLCNEVERLCQEALRSNAAREKVGCSSCDGTGETSWGDRCYACRGRGTQRQGGKSWAHSFRLGAAQEIGSRIARAHEESKQKLLADAAKSQEARYLEARQEAEKSGNMDALLALDAAKGDSRYSLVRVQGALARIEAHQEEVGAWVKAHVGGLHKGGRRTGASDGGAYDLGRKAGATVSLSPAKGRLPGGAS